MSNRAPNILWTEHLDSARVWRAKLMSPKPIPIKRTAEVSDVFRTVLMRMAEALHGDHTLPPDLYPNVKPENKARRPGPLEVHSHAYFLPEDLNADGYISHLAVVSARNVGGLGLSRKGLALLNLCPSFWLKDVGDVRVEPINLGPVCVLGTDAASHVWHSMTPFLPPLHHHSPDHQIRECLKRLGLPIPVSIDRIGSATVGEGRLIPANTFAARKEKRDEGWTSFQKRVALLAYWTIRFGEPLTGPVLLGGNAHFGLGRFAPMPET